MHATVNDVNRRKTLRNVVLFTVAVWSVGWIAAALQPGRGDESEQQLGLLLWLVTPLAMLGLAPSLLKNVFEELAWRVISDTSSWA